MPRRSPPRAISSLGTLPIARARVLGDITTRLARVRRPSTYGEKRVGAFVVMFVSWVSGLASLCGSTQRTVAKRLPGDPCVALMRPCYVRMRSMKRRLNLNLLVALDALLENGGVS